jgi:hypothetical protein
MSKRIFSNHTLFLVLSISLSMVMSLCATSTAHAINDLPEKQADANRSSSNGQIKEYADHCNGVATSNGLAGNNPVYEKCVIDRCALMSNRQYRDTCIIAGFVKSPDLNCGSLLPPGGTNKDPQRYFNCIGRLRLWCSRLGTYQWKGHSPKDFCLYAASWKASPYSASQNSKPESEGGITNKQAYDEFYKFMKGDLSPNEELVFIGKLFSVKSKPPETIDTTPDTDADFEDCDLDKSGSIDTTGDKECQAKKFADAEPVPEALKCKGGAGGIQISTPINGNKCIGVSQNGGIADNPIINILRIVIKVAAAGVGLVVAGMIVVAGIQYSTSQGNPQRTVAAKQRLINAIIGLIMFIFATVILNYVVPGGIIGGV